MKLKILIIIFLTGITSLSFRFDNKTGNMKSKNEEMGANSDLKSEFLKLRFGMFIHYNMKTYQDAQWSPELLDTDEILPFFWDVRSGNLVNANWWNWSKKGTPYADIAVTEVRHFPKNNKVSGETCWQLAQTWF